MTFREMVKLIREDWHTHDRDWTRPGFHAVAVHRFGNWRVGVEPKLVRAPLSVAYRALYGAIRNVYGIELPYTARVGRRVVFEQQQGIVIHGQAHIGDECVIGHQVTLGNRTVGYAADAPRLGRGVNVGSGAKILGAITVGDGAAIGANAVVLTDVPAGASAVGVPARVVSVPAAASAPPRQLRQAVGG